MDILDTYIPEDIIRIILSYLPLPHCSRVNRTLYNIEKYINKQREESIIERLSKHDDDHDRYYIDDIKLILSIRPRSRFRVGELEWDSVRTIINPYTIDFTQEMTRSMLEEYGPYTLSVLLCLHISNGNTRMAYNIYKICININKNNGELLKTTIESCVKYANLDLLKLLYLDISSCQYRNIRRMAINIGNKEIEAYCDKYA